MVDIIFSSSFLDDMGDHSKSMYCCEKKKSVGPTKSNFMFKIKRLNLIQC